MKKIIILAIVLMQLLGSIGGCYWRHPGRDRHGSEEQHHQYRNEGQYHHDRGDGDHERR